VTQLEQRRRQDQALRWEYQERDSQGAHERARLLETVAKLQDELNHREEDHRAEVADLQDKAADIGNRNCYLNSKVLELQSELDDKKAEFNRKGDRERSKGIGMLKIQSRNKTLTQELEEFRKKAVRN
jgi:chromosome segregation ATPase